jgi:hypothetical protein
MKAAFSPLIRRTPFATVPTGLSFQDELPTPTGQTGSRREADRSMNRFFRAARRTSNSAPQARISRVTLALLRVPRAQATAALVTALAGIAHAGPLVSPSSAGSLGDCFRHFRSVDARPFRG